MINFLDIKHQYTELREELDGAVKNVLRDGLYVGGKYLSKFEEKFAGYLGADDCIGVGNGMDALSLLLRAQNLPVGSKIIIPNNTFIATALAVTNAGFKIVLCDVDKKTRNISVETLKSVWTEDISCVIFVHLFGSPAGITSVKQFCKEKKAFLIEDCAQCHGAKTEGKKIGADGNCAWSFYPGKNLGAFGDGGAVTVNDGDLAAKIRALGNYGSFKKYEHSLLGVNSRLDPLQAALLTVKLSKLDEWNDMRRKIAKQYLSEIDQDKINLPNEHDNCKQVWHLFVIEVEDRQNFRAFMETEGIQTGMHYPSTILHQKCFTNTNLYHGDLACSEELSKKIVSLPMGPHLSLADVDRIVEVVNKWK